MDNVISERLRSMRFGPLQQFKNIAVLPLLAEDGAFEYRTLGTALAASEITITEVSAGGSVPELLVDNRGAAPVLLLDGEELIGAKQNRVLNASILLKNLSKTRIPVSCTEQGRWAYASPAFAQSENVMAFKARARKSSSVSRSLEHFASYASNQAAVWDDIAHLEAKAAFQSPTSAMKDLFESRSQQLDECTQTFTCLPGQVGLLVLIDGVPVGLETMSRSAGYTQIHPKLVRSYTLENLIEARSEAPDIGDPVAKGRDFLETIAAAEERPFPSVGCGQDYRFRGKDLAGSALVHENEVIHAAWFRLEPPGTKVPNPMAPFRTRRQWLA